MKFFVNTIGRFEINLIIQKVLSHVSSQTQIHSKTKTTLYKAATMRKKYIGFYQKSNHKMNYILETLIASLS